MNESIIQELKTEWDLLPSNSTDQVWLNRIQTALKNDKLELADVYMQKIGDITIKTGVLKYLNNFRNAKPKEQIPLTLEELDKRVKNLETGINPVKQLEESHNLEQELKQEINDLQNKIFDLENNNFNSQDQIEQWKNNPEGLGIGTIFQALYTSGSRDKPLFDLEDFKIIGKENFRQICKFNAILESYKSLDDWNTWVNNIENPHPADSEAYNQWENRQVAFQQVGQEIGQIAMSLSMILKDYIDYYIYE